MYAVTALSTSCDHVLSRDTSTPRSSRRCLQVVVVRRPEIELRQLVDQPHSLPRRLQVDVVPLERDLRRAQRLERDELDQVLHAPHRVLVVGVGLVPLEHRELGVVLVRHALVAEVLADLVDLLEPTDDQPLEIELGRDAQVEILVEHVVVRDERLGERPAVARLEDRRLDLDEALAVQIAANRRDDPRPQHEVAPHLLVHQQVEVALAVALLDVGQAVEGVRERRAVARQEHELVDDQRRLAAARSSSACPSRRRRRRGARRPRRCALRGTGAGSGRCGRRDRGRRACPCRGAPSRGRRAAAPRRPPRPARAPSASSRTRAISSRSGNLFGVVAHGHLTIAQACGPFSGVVPSRTTSKPCPS